MSWAHFKTMEGLKGFIHYCAQNDYNGNPQRLYVLSDETGKNIACWDEGYMGSDAVPGIWRKDAYQAQRFNISVTKYKQLLRTLPSPKWADEVEGYERLAYMANVDLLDLKCTYA
jgi:hypothetical protein